MNGVKNKISDLLYKIRNRGTDEQDRAFNKKLVSVRLLFLLPFLIAAIIFLLLSSQNW